MVTVTVDEDARRVTTRFEDGAELVAAPNYATEHIERAKQLGYKGIDGVWQMTRDHDRAHSLLAAWLGQRHSPVLYGEATGTPPDPAVAANEEALVLLLQKVANQGIGAVFAEVSGAR
jgi:hypothetical protein